jgi:phenylacetate-CoA ligase
MRMVLEEPGPKVMPPLKMVVKHGPAPCNLAELKNEIEKRIKATLSVPCSVELVVAGTLPRYEMKGQLVEKAYQSRGAV